MDIAGLDGGLSLSEFQELLAEKTGVPASHQELLGGFPPAPIPLPAIGSSTLGDLPIANGDTIVVRRKEVSTTAAASAATTADGQPVQQTAEQTAQVSTHIRIEMSMEVVNYLHACRLLRNPCLLEVISNHGIYTEFAISALPVVQQRLVVGLLVVRRIA